MPIYTPGKVTLRRTWAPMDPDAAAYITAVETADGQALEQATKIAIDNFVLGCKADGIWPAIKASCILAGARTLTGALVPLAGTAPTNVNFVSGDYNRKTGLGDASNTTKYLNSNRLDSADPQNNHHQSVYTTATGTAGFLIGVRGGLNVPSNIYFNGGTRSRGTATFLPRSVAYSTGFIGNARNTSTLFQRKYNAQTDFFSNVSSSPESLNTFVFATNIDAAPLSLSGNRLAFYSIGESLDLTLLDARVTDLITAFGVAIP
jgi:hypothetical protein